MNWGKSIALFYTLFVVAILSVVAFSFTQDVNIISEDYYQQEIAYEEQIERLKNTNELEVEPGVELVRNHVKVVFADNLKPKGNILFFRPSDGSKDWHVPISLGADGTQQIDFSTRQQGKWIVKLLWRDGDKEYYKEFSLYKK